MSDLEKSGEKTTPSGARASRRRSRSGLVGFVLVALLIAAGAGVYYFVPLSGTRAPQMAATEIPAAADAGEDLRMALAELEGRIEQTEGRIDRLETAPQAPAISAREIDALDLTIAQLARRIDDIENRVPADLAARLESYASRNEQNLLAERLSDLEAANSGEMLRRAARILALADLSRAAMGPAPFAVQLDAVAATSPGDAAITHLRPHATSGVPTVSELAERFPAAMRAALAAERGSVESDFLARLWNSLAGLISIRRIGAVEGEDTASRLARAEAAWRGENPDAALVEVDAVQGPAAAALAPWRGQAAARRDVESAIASINARIAQMLAGQSAPIAR